MHRKTILILLISSLYGCSSSSKVAPEPVVENKIFQGTIGSICELVGYQAVKVQGYSLVIGLAGTGSSECSVSIQKNHLEKTLRCLKDQGFLPGAYMDLSIDEIIDHSSTAVVRVSGTIPAGSLEGDRFDVEVTALEGTQTTSLQGGRLVRSELQVVVPGYQGRLVASRPTALAHGHIFINPFPVRQGADQKVDPRRGVILGGGRTTYDSKISLSLLQPDYRKAQLIQSRINSRFQTADDTKIAEATGRSSIILRAPKAYRDQYSHFISLVWSLYLQSSPGYQDRKSQELIELARQPDADFESISLAWEGIGRSMVSKLYPIYQDTSSGKAAYYAAKAALNLEDYKAMDAMVHMAMDDTHPCQIQAVQSLREHPDHLHAHGAMLNLLQKNNYRIRLLAYEGLRKSQDIVIHSSKLGEGFTIDQVYCEGKPIVAVWAAKNPRIVIFGATLKCRDNLFYASTDNKVTLNARPGDAYIGIKLTIPKNRGYVSRQSPFEVKDLIKVLARPVRSNKGNHVIGPGLSFSEIVGILYTLCNEGMIPAQFTLHRDTEDWTG